MLPLMLLLAATLPATARPTAPCTLTAAEKKANAALAFDDFDQKGALPSTFRSLSDRGCDREAAAATEDDLLHGPPRTDHQQRLMLWHLAQVRALAGDERQAAELMAGTRVPAATITDQGFDWDDYVEASWAFLVKDRAVFDAAAGRLAASGSALNRRNAAIIAAMGRCWTKSYRVAYHPACGR